MGWTYEGTFHDNKRASVILAEEKGWRNARFEGTDELNFRQTDRILWRRKLWDNWKVQNDLQRYQVPFEGVPTGWGLIVFNDDLQKFGMWSMITLILSDFIL